MQSLVFSEPARTATEVQGLLLSAQQLESPAHEAQALMLLVGCAFLQGQYTEMLGLAQEVLQISRQTQSRNQALESRALNNIGLAYQRLGRLELAMSSLLEALRLAIEHLDQEGSSRALSNIALIYTTLDEYDVASSLHEQALEAARSCGSSPLIADTLGSLLGDRYQLRQFRQAFDLSDEAIAFAQERGLVRYECVARTTLSLMLLHLGRAKTALLNAEAGLALAARADDEESRAGLLLAAGQAQLLLHQTTRAEATLQECLELSVRLDHRDHEWQAHEALAKLYDFQGNTVQARFHFLSFNEKRQVIYAQETTQRTQALAQQAQLEWDRRSSGQYPWSHALTGLLQSLNQAKTELAMISTFDLLTGVANRSHFQMRAQRRLDLTVEGENVGMIFVGLDFMKALNERFGHSVGDSVLVEAARRLQAQTRAGDLVGRLGSDEFVVMLSYLADPSDLNDVMQRILQAFQEPFQLRGQSVQVTASLGGAAYPEDCQRLEDLLRFTDIALQQAKTTGRNQSLRFDPEMLAEKNRRTNLLYDLRTAVPDGQLRLHYQAQFDLSGRNLTGAEALVRWQHPERGLIFPGQFIPLAEEHRFIIEIGDWVLQEACRQARVWQFAERGLKMSVNVSAVQFEQPDFVQKVAAALQQHELQPGAIVLELTESMVLSGERDASITLEQLQALGVRVALDDFGAGFSSLNSLQRLHLDYLKIDRAFMTDLARNATQFQRARMLVDMMINLAHNMNMKVVAEGVEKEEQFELLADLGCDQVQGFLLAHPISAQEFESRNLGAES